MSGTRIEARYWRMLSIEWQRAPFDSGSHLIGGRFNQKGTRALYLSADHVTAIGEFHQLITRPGTLVGYDIMSNAIVDLTDPANCAAEQIAPEDLACPWYDFVIRGEEPPSWRIAGMLRDRGADGILVPSFQTAGTNLVLWRWHRAGTAGEGAAVTVIDPGGDLLP